MDHFYDNSLQTGLMRDLGIDLELLGEHLVLLGNQVRPLGMTESTLLDLNFLIGRWQEQNCGSVSICVILTATDSRY